MRAWKGLKFVTQRGGNDSKSAQGQADFAVILAYDEHNLPWRGN
jgi:hypothetical protein